MSYSERAISVRGLAKAYSIAHKMHKSTTLAEAVGQKIRHPFRTVERETFWALNDVSFEINRGDVVGVVGRNGSGKSTLLKLLSRITEPTRGEIDIHGRVGSLLEVGTGFHPELTGRENVFLNGAILGMTRAEVSSQFDAIVDFSGVERFLDTPVKRYSSGMYVRLAFAVAAHLQSEILLVDEVLAVGDSAFQAKCLNKMKDVTRYGRTVLFVSHNMSSVAELCDSAILLNAGQLKLFDRSDKVIQQYFIQVESSRTPEAITHRLGSGELRIESVIPEKEVFEPEDVKVFKFKVRQMTEIPYAPFMVFEFLDESSAVVARCDSRLLDWYVRDKERYEGTLTLRTPWLKPGRYRLRVEIDNGTQYVDVLEDACWITISGRLPYPMAASEDTIRRGIVLSDFSL